MLFYTVCVLYYSTPLPYNVTFADYKTLDQFINYDTFL